MPHRFEHWLVEKIDHLKLKIRDPKGENRLISVVVLSTFEFVLAKYLESKKKHKQNGHKGGFKN